MHNYRKLAKVLAKAAEPIIDGHIKFLKFKNRNFIISSEDIITVAQNISPRFVKLILETNQDDDVKLEKYLTSEIQRLMILKLNRALLTSPKSRYRTNGRTL